MEPFFHPFPSRATPAPQEGASSAWVASRLAPARCARTPRAAESTLLLKNRATGTSEIKWSRMASTQKVEANVGDKPVIHAFRRRVRGQRNSLNCRRAARMLAGSTKMPRETHRLYGANERFLCLM